jgi:hypothetical protein
MYKDGDPTNNAASNLEWATVQDQQRLLRDRHLEKAKGDEVVSGTTVSNGSAALDLVDEVPFVPTAESDPLLDQLHATQKRLEAEERRCAELRRAIAPFATFHLSPALATAVGKATVLEANRGGNHHCVLTVQDFREAKVVFERPTGDSS